MKPEIPKLGEGDEIRVVSLSRSISIISHEVREIAMERLNELGLSVSLAGDGEWLFQSPSPETRIRNLHEAMESDAKGILTPIGGWIGNTIIDKIDYGLVGRNIKAFCGYSDITVFHLAFLTKAGMGTYYGPHFSSFGMRKGAEYMIEYFRKVVMEKGEFELEPSREWSDDAWFLDQENRKFFRNEGYWHLSGGDGRGIIIAGNLNTLRLLQGTEYFPDLGGAILFIEEDEESKPWHFMRDLKALSLSPGFNDIAGMVIGRFQLNSDMSRNILEKILEAVGILDMGIPVIANADFGHTMPMATIPVGGHASLEDGRIFIRA